MSGLTTVLNNLEAFHGTQTPEFPTDPYQFLIWWHCGYPASDRACTRGWHALNVEVGMRPQQLLAASTRKLARALQQGGLIPDLRASRLLQIATRVQDDFSGDFNAALSGPLPKAKKLLKSFPGIAGPGIDRILLFAGIAPLAAVPSSSPEVLVRILNGSPVKDYTANYRTAQNLIDTELPPDFDTRKRAYLLLKRHGQEVCKRTHPRCGECPLNQSCLFANASTQG